MVFDASKPNLDSIFPSGMFDEIKANLEALRNSEISATFPENPVAGMLFYNSVEESLFVRNSANTIWNEVSNISNLDAYVTLVELSSTLLNYVTKSGSLMTGNLDIENAGVHPFLSSSLYPAETLPNDYPFGISLIAIGAGTWPTQYGLCVNYNRSSGRFIQIVFACTGNSPIFYRVGLDNNTWGRWIDITTGEINAFPIQTSKGFFAQINSQSFGKYLCSYRNDTPGVTPYLRITTNITSPGMFKVRISGYNYSDAFGQHMDIIVSGYRFTTDSVIRYSFINHGNFLVNIYVGFDVNSKMTIIIEPKETTAFEYPQIVVEDALLGYSSSLTSELQEWTFTRTMDIADLTNLIPITQAIITDIIDYGETINGTYVRYTNGIQQCWLYLDSAVISGSPFSFYESTYFTNVNGVIGLNMTYHNFRWTFPAAFFERPVITASMSRAINVAYMQYTAAGSADTNFTYIRNVRQGTESTSVRNLSLFATGRWK